MKNVFLKLFSILPLLGIVFAVIAFAFGSPIALATTGDNTTPNGNWGLIDAKIFEAHKITKGSSSVNVGVIDTGIYGNHTGLDSAIASNGHWDFAPDDDDTELDDLNGHGTHVAGIIASEYNETLGTIGVAPNVKVVSLKYAESLGALLNLASAIQHAANTLPDPDSPNADDNNQEDDIPILNLSLGSQISSDDYDGSDICLKVHDYYDRGGLIIIAAGNDGNNIDNADTLATQMISDTYFNSADPNNQKGAIIVVGALDSNGDPWSGSCYGENTVDLFAPGAYITSTYPSNKCTSNCAESSEHICSGYHALTGTSMATPFVAGVAALLKSLNPSLSGKQIKQIIVNTVDEVQSLSGKCVTGGKLNAFRAVESIAYEFSVQQDSATITGLRDTAGGALILPEQICDYSNNYYNYTVTKVGAGAFANCTELTEITIPDCVVYIGQGAFSGCSSLTSVTLPSGLTEIERETFYGCSSLQSITIPSDVEYIDSYAFTGSGLCSVIFDEDNPSLEYIGQYAFAYCIDLSSISLPNGLITIDNNAFSNCLTLTNITIPSTVTHINNGAFLSCTLLCSVTFAGTESSPANISHIGNYAFSNCTNIANFTIPQSVTYVGASAFFNWSSIQHIGIEGSRANWSANWLNGCYAGVIRLGNETAEVVEYLIFDDSEHGLAVSVNPNVSIVSITIPATYEGSAVEAIADYGFYECTTLQQINFEGESLLYVGEGAFANCTNLTNITIPYGVTEIGDYAFYNCNSLQNASLPMSVATVGEYAFYNCNALQSMTLSNGVEMIEANVIVEGYAFTIYTDAQEQGGLWLFLQTTNSSITVLYGCTLSEGNAYVISITADSSAINDGIISAPYREGYVFSGWSTAENGSPVYTMSDLQSGDLDGMTLYAVWA